MNPEKAAIDCLQKLVQQPSVSGNEKGVVEAAGAEMRSLGFDEVWTDETGNVIGLIKGHKPGKRILFDAHVDVVNATTPENWNRPPFSGEFADGRIWGRGSTDNKGSLSAMMAGLSALPREEISGSIYVVGSVGEETLEGIGHAQTVDALKPDYVVIGEPTDCRIGFGQRGRARLIFRVPGSAGHSSADDQTGNAVYAMARLIARLEGQSFPHDPLLGDAIQAPIELMSNPYPSLSTVPVECKLAVDRRLLLGETEESVVSDYQKRIGGLPDATVEMDVVTYASYTGKQFKVSDFHPAWVTGADSAFLKGCLAGVNAAGLPAVSYPIPYCTNGSYCAGVLGIPTIVFGPGSILQAHAMNEFLEVKELHKALRCYQEITRKVLSLG